jgi:Ca2+:H+ antiporter
MTDPQRIFEHVAAGGPIVFVVAAVALVPLAWLVGEATEHAAEHTGSGIGGFLNASFGNAPELIIALVAIHGGLPDIVRGSIAGSVVSNLLLVLGLTMVAGRGAVDRRSLTLQLGLLLAAVVAFLGPSLAGRHGDPDRTPLFVVALPIAAVALALYVVVSVRNLRRHRRAYTAPASGGWSLRRAVATLALATVATALVSEALVGSLTSFGDALGLSDFFVAAVIVAIVGNAAEHGGAVVVARRGKTALASEIAVASAAQVAVCVAPAVVLLSWLVGRGLPLSFRPIELGSIAVASLLVAAAVLDGRSTRPKGIALVVAYLGAALAFGLAGDR